MEKFSRLQDQLGYRFNDESLLSLALTHRSFSRSNNERLEFLGDSILNHVIAEALYQRFEQVREGDLSRLRASLVRGETLAEIARELALGDYLRMDSGARKTASHRRDSVLSDTLEAVAGAILLDGGHEACRRVLLALFTERLEQLDANDGKDPKTRLQEYLQGRQLPLPVYRLVKVSEQDHEQHFTCSCQISKPPLSGEGSGSSRRRAEQAAAGEVLDQLSQGG